MDSLRWTVAGNVAPPFNSEGMYRAWGYAGDEPSTDSIVNMGQRVPHSEELDTAKCWLSIS